MQCRCGWLTLLQPGDRNTPGVQPEAEIGGPIQRIDDPQGFVGSKFELGALFGQDQIIRVGPLNG
jgi:hypothetical protein